MRLVGCSDQVVAVVAVVAAMLRELGPTPALPTGATEAMDFRLQAAAAAAGAVLVPLRVLAGWAEMV